VPGRRVYLLVIACCVQFLVLTLLAMLFYPGGTLYDASTVGYSFFGNFFSELGITLTYTGKSNAVSAVIFTFSLTVFGIGIAAFFAATQYIVGTARSGRAAARAGAVFGIAAGLAFIGVAATPANRLLGMHVAFLCIAFPAVMIAAALHSVALFLAGPHLRRFGETHAAAAVFLAGYLVLAAFGPGLKTPYGVRFQASAQKAAAYPIIAFAIYQSVAAMRLAAIVRGASSPYGFAAASKTPETVLGEDRAANSQLIREKAAELGADRVGICPLNRKWLSTKHHLDRNPPIAFTSVVVIAVNMDPEAFRKSPSPEIRGETRKGYRRMEKAAGGLASFLARCGYNALSAGNGESLSVPQAVEAGMGLLGRNGMLLSEDAGPCLRICKVFTDAPLEPDARPEAVTHDLCRVCVKCAEACPADAIEEESEPSDDVWRVNPALCNPYWKQTNKECAACISSCPLTWKRITEDT
jgi:NAD-dependent dihydropyrimidine dehydrogenase PreA subunit